jgi:hypothetical protein
MGAQKTTLFSTKQAIFAARVRRRENHGKAILHFISHTSSKVWHGGSSKSAAPCFFSANPIVRNAWPETGER